MEHLYLCRKFCGTSLIQGPQLPKGLLGTLWSWSWIAVDRQGPEVHLVLNLTLHFTHIVARRFLLKQTFHCVQNKIQTLFDVCGLSHNLASASYFRFILFHSASHCTAATLLLPVFPPHPIPSHLRAFVLAITSTYRARCLWSPPNCQLKAFFPLHPMSASEGFFPSQNLPQPVISSFL